MDEDYKELINPSINQSIKSSFKCGHLCHRHIDF